MGRLVLIALVAVAIGCGSSGGKGPAPDADLNAPLCTGVLYDNCSSASQCMSGDCHLFMGEFQVCTQPCTAGDDSTCPLSSGMTSKCNNRGICKPAVNNMCRPPS